MPCLLTEGRHFGVVSGEMFCTQHGPIVCWADVVAFTHSEARVKACELPEFEEWVSMRRGDGQIPFGGVSAVLMVCEHDNCWGCQDCPRCVV